MKKLILFGIIMVHCSFIPKMQAQSSVGAKAGANLSNFWINESSHLESKPKTGVSLGNFYKYRIREGVAVEADVMFHCLTSKIKNLTTGQTADYHYVGMEIPVSDFILIFACGY